MVHQPNCDLQELIILCVFTQVVIIQFGLPGLRVVPHVEKDSKRAIPYVPKNYRVLEQIWKCGFVDLNLVQPKVHISLFVSDKNLIR